MTDGSGKPKTARSYRATVVGDNTVVSINLKWAGQVFVLVAGLVYSYLQVENRIRELERRVDSGEMAVAFALHPVSMEQLLTIADADQIMPPKTTWFEPKLRSGLVVHELG